MAGVKDEKREGKREKVLDPKDLALYLGCRFMDLSGENGNDPEKIYLLNPQALADIDHFVSDLNDIKPILRPFSDMNKKEYAQCKKKCRIVYHEGTRIEADCPEYNMFLLSRYFDLFGWIDEGSAIDATTLSPNPYNR